MNEILEDKGLSGAEESGPQTSPSAGGDLDDNEKTGLRVAVIVAVVILVLFGLYWGGKMLLLPKDESDNKPSRGEGAEVSIETECDNPTVYTSINSALGNAKNVCKMDLSGQGLSSISVYIGRFRNLVELDISDNNITSLPAEIGWLKKLQKFDASNNDLTQLALEIGWLRELKEWDLSNNQITSVPAEIGWLKKMENLNLANNKLKEVPLQLGWMAKMKTLDLSGNAPEVKTSANRLRVWMPRANIILP